MYTPCADCGTHLMVSFGDDIDLPEGSVIGGRVYCEECRVFEALEIIAYRREQENKGLRTYYANAHRKQSTVDSAEVGYQGLLF